jgi:WD40 repeat protein
MDRYCKVEKIRELSGHTGAIYAMAAGKDGSLYTAGGDGMLVCWHPLLKGDGELIARFPGPVYSLVLTPDGNWIAGAASGDLYVSDGKGGVRRITAHRNGIFALHTREDGRILSGGGDGRCLLWDEDLRFTEWNHFSQQSLRTLIAIPGERYAAGYSDHRIRIWHSDNPGQTTQLIEAHQGSVFSLAYHHARQVLYSGGRDALLKTWIPDSKVQAQLSVPAHLLHIHSLSLNPSQTLLASGSMDKTIKIWEPETLKLLKVINAANAGAHTSSVNKIVWLGDDICCACSDDRSIRIFRISAVQA